MNVDDALKRISSERTVKAAAAGLGIAALLALVLGVTYASYKDVPAPTNPANATGEMVDPYGH